MKFRQSLFLTVIIATPLFLRQRQVERHLATQLRSYTDECNRVVEKGFKDWDRWGTLLVAEIKRAMAT
jgi:hypothetical protein